MLIDSSAIVESIVDGPQAPFVLERLRLSTTDNYTVPTVIFESCASVARILSCDVAAAHGLVTDFLSAAHATIIPITAETGQLAVETFARYGKGRGHPARLNFGDCFSYAACKLAGVPLLYIGRDFARTDLA